MVPVATPSLDLITLRYDQLTKSVDLAIRDLLAAGSDPVALACYLWVCRRHNLQLINSAGLANWGSWWVQHILLDEHWGRKRDDDISSALLVAGVMQEASSLRGLSDSVREAANKILAKELDRHAIPFNHPGPGALTLLGSADLALSDTRLLSSITAMVGAFEQSISAGRAFGITFAILAHKRASREGDLSLLATCIIEVIDDPETDYEDRIYLSQALCHVALDGRTNEDSFRYLDMVVADSPAWTYLMSGQEDIPSASDGRTMVVVSHLCRAALLDTLIIYQEKAKERAERRIDVKYRGRLLTGLPAFGFYVIIFATMWFYVLRILIDNSDLAWRFLILHEYEGISWVDVVTQQFAMFSALPLLMITITSLATFWQFLVRSPVESDQRIIEVLWRRNRWFLGFWCVSIVFAIIVNLYSALVGPAVEHIVSGK